jgi:8-oxo-dGTP diphosphatase
MGWGLTSAYCRREIEGLIELTNPFQPTALVLQTHRQNMAGTKLILVVACALVDADRRVLIAQRPEGKTLAGLWEFPGGKLEPGERPESTLIRELHEEIGITVKEACLAPLTFASHAYDDFHLLMPLYICRRWEGDVIAREGQNLAWARANKLRDYKMPPADIPLIPHLIDLLM